MQITKRLLFLPLLTLVFGSCAAIFESNYQKIMISSRPEGADIYIMGYYAGKTPKVIPIKKSAKSVAVDLILDGYKPKRFFIYSKGTDVTQSTLCKVDFTLGWALFGIPVEVDKMLSKKCNFFFRNDYLETLDPIGVKNESYRY